MSRPFINEEKEMHTIFEPWVPARLWRKGDMVVHGAEAKRSCIEDNARGAPVGVAPRHAPYATSHSSARVQRSSEPQPTLTEDICSRTLEATTMADSSASSRAPSRSPTPVPSPQRISLSTLSISKPTRSISSLQVQSSPSPKPTHHHMPSIPSSGVQSSASSIINVDPSEGILVPEVDAEVDIIEGDAAGAIAGFRRSPAEDEVSKKALRDQLRRTLSARESPNGQY